MSIAGLYCKKCNQKVAYWWVKKTKIGHTTTVYCLTCKEGADYIYDKNKLIDVQLCFGLAEFIDPTERKKNHEARNAARDTGAKGTDQCSQQS